MCSDQVATIHDTTHWFVKAKDFALQDVVIFEFLEQEEPIFG